MIGILFFQKSQSVRLQSRSFQILESRWRSRKSSVESFQPIHFLGKQKLNSWLEWHLCYLAAFSIRWLLKKAWFTWLMSGMMVNASGLYQPIQKVSMVWHYQVNALIAWSPARQIRLWKFGIFLTTNQLAYSKKISRLVGYIPLTIVQMLHLCSLLVVMFPPIHCK